ncbi:MAG: hypothetical protein WC323_00630, partial [Patescibacteria group bacterium]
MQKGEPEEKIINGSQPADVFDTNDSNLNQSFEFSGDKYDYISLADAAKYTKFSQDYISLLARNKKMPAKKFGRNWKVRMVDVNEYIKRIEKKQVQREVKKELSGATKAERGIAKAVNAISPFNGDSYSLSKAHLTNFARHKFQTVLASFLILTTIMFSCFFWLSPTYASMAERGLQKAAAKTVQAISGGAETFKEKSVEAIIAASEIAGSRIAKIDKAYNNPESGFGPEIKKAGARTVIGAEQFGSFMENGTSYLEQRALSRQGYIAGVFEISVLETINNVNYFSSDLASAAKQIFSSPLKIVPAPVRYALNGGADAINGLISSGAEKLEKNKDALVRNKTSQVAGATEKGNSGKSFSDNFFSFMKETAQGQKKLSQAVQSKSNDGLKKMSGYQRNAGLAILETLARATNSIGNFVNNKIASGKSRVLGIQENAENTASGVWNGVGSGILAVNNSLINAKDAWSNEEVESKRSLAVLWATALDYLLPDSLKEKIARDSGLEPAQVGEASKEPVIVIGDSSGSTTVITRTASLPRSFAIDSIIGSPTVTGDLTVEGGVTAGGDVVLEKTLTVGGRSDFKAPIYSSSGDFIIDDNLTAYGSITGSSLNISNAAIVNTLQVSGQANVGGLLSAQDLTVSNNASVGGTFTVAGQFISQNISATRYIAAGYSLSSGGSLTVSKDASIGEDLTVGNDLIVEGSIRTDGTLTVNRGASITGNTIITGDATITGSLTLSSWTTPYAQVKVVAKSGTGYSTIAAALNSITDASATKRYLIQVMPGEYNEQVNLKSYVDIAGEGADTTVISQADADVITASSTTSTASSTISGLTAKITAATAARSLVNLANASDIVIKNIDLKYESGTAGYGVYATSSSPVIENVNMSGGSLNYGLYQNGDNSESGTIVRNSRISAVSDIYVAGTNSTVYSYDNKLSGTYSFDLATSTAIVESTNDAYQLATSTGIAFTGTFRDLTNAREYAETGNSLAVGDIIYLVSAETVAKADASDATKLPAIGIVIKDLGVNRVLVKNNGQFYNSSASYVANQTYYIDDGGAATTTPYAGRYSQAIGVAKSDKAIELSFSRSSALSVIENTTASAMLINQQGSGNIFQLQDNGANVMTIFDGGNISIGTSSSDNLLTLWGATSGTGASLLSIADSASTTLLTILDNGYIGIGTSTPIVSLDIYATDAIRLPAGTTAERPTGGNGMLRFNIDSNTFEGYSGSSWSAIGGSLIDADQDTYILAESSGGADEDTLFFYNAGQEKMRLTSDGYLGIGTTSPYALLTVWATSTDAALFSAMDTASTTVFTILPNGNVGLGTTTPSAQLSIAGADNKIRLSHSAGNYGEIYADSLGNLNLSAANDIYVRNNLVPVPGSTHTVGSVTNYWTHGYFDELTVNTLGVASTTVSGTLTSSFTINSDAEGDEDSSLIFYRGGGVLGNATLNWKSASDRFEFGDASNPYELYVHGNLTVASTTATSTISTGGFAVGTDQFLVQQTSGRVGIGTTSPSVAFAIDATDAMVIPVGTTAQRPDTGYTGMLRYNSDNTTFEGYNGSVWSGLGGVIDVDQDTYIIAESSSGADEDVLFFYTANSEKMRLTSGGYLGIGTTSPDAVLHIASSTGGTLILDDSGGVANDRLMEFDMDGGALTIRSLNDALTTNIDNILVLDNGTGNVRVGNYFEVGDENNDSNKSVYIDRSFTGTANAFGIANVGTITGAANSNIYGAYFANNFTEAGSGTHALFAQGYFASSTITADGATITDAMTLYIGGAPSGATNNYGLYVAPSVGYSVPALITDSSNNVGIGTTSPSKMFSVHGEAYFSATTTIEGQVLAQTLSSYDPNTGVMPAPAYSFYSDGDTGMFNSEANNLAFATNGQMRVNLFDTAMQGAVAGTFRLNHSAAGTEGAPTYAFWGSNSDTGMFSPEDGALAFTANATEKIRITSDGNVGIGTISPTYNLDVTGNAHFTGLVDASHFIATSTTATSTFYGGFAAGNNAGLIVNQAAPANSLYINSAGNVGVGTADMIGQLTVKGDLSIYTDYDGLATIKFSRETTGAPSYVGNISYNHNSNSMGFVVNGDSRMAINSSGNVGIGTSTPWAQLSVEGQGSKPEFLVTGTDMTPDFIVDVNGNVGIGTTSPYAKLSVVGQTVSEYFTATSTSATSTFPYLASTQSNLGTVVGGTWQGTEVGVNYGGTGTSTAPSYGYVLVGNATNDGYDYIATSTFGGGGGTMTSFILSDSSNTETIENSDTLTIQGSANEITVLVGATDTATISLPDVVYIGDSGKLGRDADNLIDFTTDNQIMFRTNAVDNRLVLDNAGRIGIGTSTMSSMFTVWGDTSATGASLFSVVDNASSTLMTILDTGRIGIGTTSPLATFSVQGTANQDIFTIASSTGASIFKVSSLGKVSIGTGGGNYEITPTDGSLGIDGYLGVGTSTPAEELGVAGDIYLSGSLKFADGSSMNAAGGVWLSNGSDYYYNAGNVGIGTTSPYAKLSVVGQTVSEYFTATSTSASSTFPMLVSTYSNVGTVQAGTWNGTAISHEYGGLEFDASAITTGGMIRGASSGVMEILGLGTAGQILGSVNGQLGYISTSTMPFISNALTKGYFLVGDDSGLAQATSTMFISSTGNVGIGDANPDQLLNIHQSAGSSASYARFTTAESESGSGNGFLIGSHSNLNAFVTNYENGDLYLTTNGVSNQLVLDSAGGVGVGTAAPTSPGNSSKFLTISGANHAGLVLIDEGASREWEIQADNGLYFMEGQGSLAVHMLIDATGNLGIGTTSPWAQLSVEGQGSKPEFLVTGTDMAPDFIVDVNGNVGIGSTTPGALFSVGSAGTGLQINSSGTITSGTWNGAAVGIAYGGTGLTTTPTDGQLLIGKTDGTYNLTTLTAGSNVTITEGDGTITIASAGGGGAGSNYGAVGALAFYATAGTTATGTDVSLLKWDSSFGRLGIGSSTPNYLLSIASSTATNFLRIATSSSGDLFTVTNTQITSKLPVNMNTTGDVQIGSDLV